MGVSSNIIVMSLPDKEIFAYVHQINEWRINGGRKKRVFLDSLLLALSHELLYDTRNFTPKSNGKNGKVYSYNGYLSRSQQTIIFHNYPSTCNTREQNRINDIVLIMYILFAICRPVSLKIGENVKNL